MKPGLGADVADFVSAYSTQSLDKFDLTGALNEMTEIIRRYRIVLPSQVAMLIKVLVSLEGTTRMLSPSFSLMELMQPFHRKMLLQRLSPDPPVAQAPPAAAGSGTTEWKSCPAA